MERNGSTVVTATKSAYSSEELEEFKQIILKKIGTAEEDYYDLKNRNNNPHGTGDTSWTPKTLEDGNASLVREHNSRMAKRMESHIDDLKRALIRIENRTYGICRETGKLISKERLRAVPHATLCVAIKKKMNGNSILSKHY